MTETKVFCHQIFQILVYFLWKNCTPPPSEKICLFTSNLLSKLRSCQASHLTSCIDVLIVTVIVTPLNFFFHNASPLLEAIFRCFGSVLLCFSICRELLTMFRPWQMHTCLHDVLKTKSFIICHTWLFFSKYSLSVFWVPETT